MTTTTPTGTGTGTGTNVGTDAKAAISARTEALLAAVAFDSSNLVPVIAQDRRTGGVRMFAWADREAVRLTADTGEAHFWSRSRQALWRKGETSGNVLHVREIRIDCDGDVILYLVDADGPSCHTGHTTCFFRTMGGIAGEGARGATTGAGVRATTGATTAATTAAALAKSPLVGTADLTEDDGPGDPPALILERLAETISRRRLERPASSYVVSLLDAGWPKVLGKISEESGELVEALPEADAAHTIHEAADLIFHVLVGLEKAGVAIDDLFAELRGRFGVSGLQEKANRPPRKAEASSPK